MTPEAFIAKWKANTRSERAACQEHFINLCEVLDEPTPNSDATGANYAFEKGATKASGGDGWADVWRRGRFAWEYKGKHKDLNAAYKQLQDYRGALENPPLLITSDIECIIIRTNWTYAVPERHEVMLGQMMDPSHLHLLKLAFTDPERLRPRKTRAALTSEAAADFAKLAGRLQDRGNDPQTVARFMIRLAFCLFADDVDLLPAGLFDRMLQAAGKNPAKFQNYVSELFNAMAERGGEVDYTSVAWFNGGLFDDASALPLNADDVALLQRTAELDWAEIDPSILGTLFERGLDPAKRSQLGAHYTSSKLIDRIIDPVIKRPLRADWDSLKNSMADLLGPAQLLFEKAMEKAAEHSELSEEVKEVKARLQLRTQLELFVDLKKLKLVRSIDVLRSDLRKAFEQLNLARQECEKSYRAFLASLRAFRVLDPACGSGNFLYMALLH